MITINAAAARGVFGSGSAKHVEFEHRLDVAMSRLRAALGGESKGVHYIETVPKKGELPKSRHLKRYCGRSLQ